MIADDRTLDHVLKSSIGPNLLPCFNACAKWGSGFPILRSD